MKHGIRPGSHFPIKVEKRFEFAIQALLFIKISSNFKDWTIRCQSDHQFPDFNELILSWPSNYPLKDFGTWCVQQWKVKIKGQLERLTFCLHSQVAQLALIFKDFGVFLVNPFSIVNYRVNHLFVSTFYCSIIYLGLTLFKHF